MKLRAINNMILNYVKLFYVYKDIVDVKILCWMLEKIVKKINYITKKYGLEKIEVYRIDREE